MHSPLTHADVALQLQSEIRRVRWQVRGLAGVLAAWVCVVLFTGAKDDLQVTKTKSIMCEQLAIMGPDDELPRIMMTATDGMASIFIMNEPGNPKSVAWSVTANKDMCQETFRDENENARIAINVPWTADSPSAIQFYENSREGKYDPARMSIGRDSKGKYVLAWNDAKGKSVKKLTDQ